MNEREKLIDELESRLPNWFNECQYPGKPPYSEMIADFILADRKRILGDIKQLLEPISKMSDDELKAFYGSVRYVAKKSLEIIKKYEGDV